MENENRSNFSPIQNRNPPPFLMLTACPPLLFDELHYDRYVSKGGKSIKLSLKDHTVAIKDGKDCSFGMFKDAKAVFRRILAGC